MVRGFDLAFESNRVSIPAMGSYCLATLMSSDRTKQIGLWITIYHIYPTPPLGQDMTQGQFFKRSLTGLNSEFSFS